MVKLTKWSYDGVILNTLICLQYAKVDTSFLKDAEAALIMYKTPKERI